ncbi:cyclic nucleotide-binding protein [Pokkaliibacter plantistimulans]|uniref:Cyclic nucleotide-binding protein n=1 Tax=Proteobacteria bacterium 228 TaxID=2083153 RepID=A0A2S5KXD2_9PROT|nr:cyclic nucleotide-binding domain-containing protein [Pokkaliibacter plantistimulans]PPC78936.1 cyclic nucleotide-binding protein [Pokkaliibacter plantistimulans]
MDIHQEVDLLRKIPMLARLDTSKLKLLAFTSRLMHYEDGEVLFSINDPADSVYLVIEGEVEIMATTKAGDFTSVVRGVNSLVGEMAVISKSRRSATVRASGHVAALCMEGSIFLQLITSNPDVALDVLRQLSDKLVEAHHTNEALYSQLELHS